MIVDMPDTSVGDLSRKLLELRHGVGAMALSRVFTLVVVTTPQDEERALAVAETATRQHPSRIVAVVRGSARGKDRIDGQIRVGGDAGASEMVVLRLSGDLTEHGEAVVLPLLLADSPVVAWWPGECPEDVSAHPIGRIARRRITDAEHTPSPSDEIRRRAATYAPGDSDLVWTRTTRWRGLLAAALDLPPYEPVTRVCVTGAYDSASADLLAAWLGAALSCDVVRARTEAGTGLVSVRLDRRSGPVDLVRPDGLVATLEQPEQPARRLVVARREEAECLADELSHLGEDDVYARTLHRGIPLLEGAALPAKEAVEKGTAPSPDASRALARRLRERAGVPRAQD
ncbi:glucose-6-phosphate dehydrogenase assembly protein OpcA [Mobilicoccus pelagius]|uniref:OxPP cycle protein OpcA n=1 Tax=Mobilicoccus pelagius NBRC 104925 TaxID=1089455 RepID=H5UTN7_9MICO|nr:glucose-6-phosphate dehydrogenase assembly protein OpcA [Mobilicoccus pelagius]GAB49095.1 OxPP cycle protein OpcA [Mobilicoccus pelagius NBRC 104925]